MIFKCHFWIILEQAAVGLTLKLYFLMFEMGIIKEISSFSWYED